jgi:glycosyltransferase involved in cell wall biosynthesis
MRPKVLIIGQHLTSRTEALRDFYKDPYIIALGSSFAKRENHFYKDKHYVRKCFPTVLGAFISYIFATIEALIRFKKRYDIVIGISHFPGLIGVILRKLRITEHNIYYAIDYYAETGSLLNRLFIKLENAVDRFNCRNSEVWDISPRIGEARGYSGKIVPLGYNRSFFRYKSPRKKSIVFVGVVSKGQGLELLKYLPKDIQVKIIGTGHYLNEIAKNLNNQDRCFRLYNFIEDERRLLDVISSSSVGFSMWSEKLNSYYGDPGKTKLYSVCGLPVIVSNHTIYSEIISKYKAGKAINYDKDELISSFAEIMDNYTFYKRNAAYVASKYCDADKIFGAL